MLIKNANKIVLKLGSTTVIDSKGIFKKKWVTSLIKDIKKYGKGKNFVIVSSGAIALGQKYLKIKKGKIKLPSYFVRFGVSSSLEMFIKNKEALEKRIRTKKTASLNPKQKKAVNYAIECISKVAPSFSSLYNSFVEDQGIYELDFKTIESKDLLGELKDSRDYDGKTIYLNKDLFKSAQV